jgi:hypothetical protein
MNYFRKWFDSFRGAGDAAVTIPSMDGALQPNNLLNRANVLFTGQGDSIANIATHGEQIFFSAGPDLYAAGSAGSEVTKSATFNSAISAMAFRDTGDMAIGLSGGGLMIRSLDGTLTPLAAGDVTFNCPIGLAFAADGALIVANGSASNRPEDWPLDLMEKNRSGSVWRVDTQDGVAKCLARDLAYPAGLAITVAGDVVVSESWRHRLLVLQSDALPRVLLDDLPGYPGAISPRHDGGYWLCIFAPRRQLIEFVLREDSYRKQMLSTVDRQYWVAPTLKSGIDYFEPVQSGEVRHLGMVKPWAPTRSYGLVVRLDSQFNPVASYHSRADALRHGITSAVEFNGAVYLTCAATNEILVLNPDLRGE